MSHTPLQKAAASILLLINNKPASPRAEEIEAIIERALGKPAERGGFTPTIGGIAAELPRLYDLRSAMKDSEHRQNEREAALHGTPPSSRPEFHAFETLKDRADVQVKALEALIFLLEPENADDALSLLLLIDSAFHEFAGEAYGERPLPADQEALWNTVTRALHALVRWLHRDGAVSPLLREHFTDGNLVPPARQTAEAMVAAAELATWHKAQLKGGEGKAA